MKRGAAIALLEALDDQDYNSDGEEAAVLRGLKSAIGRHAAKLLTDGADGDGFLGTKEAQTMGPLTRAAGRRTANYIAATIIAF